MLVWSVKSFRHPEVVKKKKTILGMCVLRIISDMRLLTDDNAPEKFNANLEATLASVLSTTRACFS